MAKTIKIPDTKPFGKLSKEELKDLADLTEDVPASTYDAVRKDMFDKVGRLEVQKKTDVVEAKWTFDYVKELSRVLSDAGFVVIKDEDTDMIVSYIIGK